MHNCSMCPFFSVSQSELIAHLVRRHRHAAGFNVYCSALGCGRSFNNYLSFKTHVTRSHPVHAAETTSSDADESGMVVPESVQSVSAGDLRPGSLCEAAYVLKLKTVHRLPHTVVSAVLNETKFLLVDRLSSVRTALEETLGIDPANDSRLTDVFRDDLFADLQSGKEQDKFWTQHFGYVKPVAVKLLEETLNKRFRHVYHMKPVSRYGYFVPFIEQLKALVSLPEVQDLLLTGKCCQSSDPFLRDITDGNYLLSHPFLRAHPSALVFALYTDDFELVNPIGSHRRKHKVTAFYWTLLNIPAEYRSKLSAIQLLALARTQDLKRSSLEILLQDFLLALRQLWHGITFGDSESVNNLTYGMLAVVIADTPAAHLLGGFKEGVSFAEKPCRRCDIARSSLSDIHVAEETLLRNETEHRDRVDMLSEVSSETFKYWSRQYGINGRSLLLDIPGFQVTKCILQDPMHVLLEGVLKHEFQCLLRVLMKKDKGLLRRLNTRIQQFEFSSHGSRDKPQVIDAKQLERGASLAQSAAEMKTLVSLLPFLMEDLVDDDDNHWLNFVRLLHITHLSLSPIASSNTVLSLKCIIATHNHEFLRLYPDEAFPPKMHYMLHFPQQIEDFGPLRSHWCMRFEAKNGFFKSKKWSNFKNICLSLSLFHQRWMCLQMVDTTGSMSMTFLYDGDKIGAGCSVPLSQLELYKEIMEYFPDADPTSLPRLVLLSSYFEVFGHRYEVGTVLLNKWVPFENPAFVRIRSLVVVNGKKFLICGKLKIIEYAVALGGFLAEQSCELVLLAASDLRYCIPQIAHDYHGFTGIIMQGAGDVFML